MPNESIMLRSNKEVRQTIFFNQCRFLEQKFNILRGLDIALTPRTAEQVFSIYCDYVKSIDPDAARVDLIQRLKERLDRGVPPELEQGLKNLLADQLYKHGKVGAGLSLYQPDHPRIKDIERLNQLQIEGYGTDLGAFVKKGHKISKGNSLAFYFDSNPELLVGKTLAHIAPERHLLPWFQQRIEEYSLTYVTIDGFRDTVHQNHDLCEMDLPDAVFDIIICHRVFEHILDHETAAKELHRVLKPGGVLNASVPELFFNESAIEWFVPDPGWHDHVRIYGRDFPKLLEKAGFSVEREDWLLERTEEELVAAQAYPYLMYNAHKPLD